MRFRDVVVILVGVGVASLACTTDYQATDYSDRYGLPNGLQGKPPPGPTLKRGCPPEQVITPTPECANSFKPVLDAFVAAGCTAGGTCHTTTPPRFGAADVAGSWQAFAEYPFPGGLLYINPCSTDPAQSGIQCNLLPTGQSCGQHMPQGSGQVTAEVVALVDTFQKCGSPKPP